MNKVIKEKWVRALRSGKYLKAHCSLDRKESLSDPLTGRKDAHKV